MKGWFETDLSADIKNMVLLFEYNHHGYSKELAALLKGRGHSCVLITNEHDEATTGLYNEVCISKEILNSNELEKLVKKICKEKNVSSVLNIVDTMSFTHARLLESMGLLSDVIKGLYCSRNKFIARKLLGKAGLSHVKYHLIRSAEDLKDAASQIRYPAVLKPVGGYGSYFVHKVTHEGELFDKYNIIRSELGHMPEKRSDFDFHWDGVKYNAMDDLLLEEYIPGDEFTVDGFVSRNEVQIVALHQKIGSTEDDGFRDNFYLTPPQNLSEAKLADIRDFVSKAVRTVGLERSIFHVEMKVKEDGGMEIIEVNPRLGGGTVRDNILNLTRIDMLDVYLDVMLGDKIPELSYEKSGIAFGCGVLVNKSGRVKNIQGVDIVKKLPQVRQLKVVYPVGSVIPSVDGEEYHVLVSCLCKSFDEAIEIKDKIQNTISVEMGGIW